VGWVVGDRSVPADLGQEAPHYGFIKRRQRRREDGQHGDRAQEKNQKAQTREIEQAAERPALVAKARKKGEPRLNTAQNDEGAESGTGRLERREGGGAGLEKVFENKKRNSCV